MDDIGCMFDNLLGEMDHLSQSLAPAAESPDNYPQRESTFSIGFTDLNESLNELEDQDLDALVAALEIKQTVLPDQNRDPDQIEPPAINQEDPEPSWDLPPPPPPPPNISASTTTMQKSEPETKADKIKLALKKIKEAKVRKMIVKVLLSDGSSKTLMVDERQTVRDVLDKLFEKTHCDCSINWSLCETNPELQIERAFEDHEYLVEQLSAWSRHSENKICFVSRPQNYMMFRDPQLFYMWKKKKQLLTEINKQAKELLIKEHFGGSTLIVPDLEGFLYLKEDGKKVWKSRYFVLRASGIYYVPKGKTKCCSDLACFIRFENVNIYTAHNYKQRYRAPTDFCFMLKHPCIMKESHYIKFLCCDDEHTMLLWVNSIRIAKYGTVLNTNYQAALRRESPQKTFADHSKGCASEGKSQQDSSPPRNTNVEDYPFEPPPDFIPPPPPESSDAV